MNYKWVILTAAIITMIVLIVIIGRELYSAWKVWKEECESDYKDEE